MPIDTLLEHPPLQALPGGSLSETWLDQLIHLFLGYVEIGSLVLVFLWVYWRFIRGNQAEPLLRGLLLILLGVMGIWLLARAFHFTLWESLISLGTQLFLVALMMIFQPELRRLLLYIGKTSWLQKVLQSIGLGLDTERTDTLNSEELTRFLQRMGETVRYLSKRQMGALMVIEPPDPNRHELAYQEEFLEQGVLLNARLSSELLITLFHPNTPLHDGACLIRVRGSKVVVAGALLPLTEDPHLSWQYGTRHRAAIGLSETSPCACVVVSEETGMVSFVHEGNIQRTKTIDELKQHLKHYLSPNRL
ncbi:MAG: diadenylate cyclase [Vampirovibrionales bacterium]